MDPFEYPPDEQTAQWAERYGVTGVKTYVLDQPNGHPANRGAVAVYHEMSLAQRQLAYRLDKIDEEYPGALDVARMAVAGCLLYPTIDAYPHPPTAVEELLPRMMQHGHGLLDADEDVIPEDREEGGLPEHLIDDIVEAREAAYHVFHDGRYSSVYKDLILELATDADGEIDIQLMDRLWHMSPGRVRDLAAQVEQAHADIQKSALPQIRKNKDLSKEEKQARADRIKRVYTSPFMGIDRVVGNRATPGHDDENQDVKAPAPTKEEVQQQMTSDLPPNRPPDMQAAIRRARDQQRGQV